VSLSSDLVNFQNAFTDNQTSSFRNGQEYSVDQLSNAPDVYVTPAENTAAWFNGSSAYTLMLGGF